MTNNLISKPEQTEQFIQRAKARIEQLKQSAQDMAAELRLPPESMYSILSIIGETVTLQPLTTPFPPEPIKAPTGWLSDPVEEEYLPRQRYLRRSELEVDERILTVYLPKSEATTLAPGTIIQNRYEIDRVIGLGGMGAVYRVRNTHFTGTVKWDALKEMIIKFAGNLDQQTRMQSFEREANLLASLNHPLIPKIYDFFSEGTRLYLVLDYIEGKNLEDVLIEAHGFLDEQLVGGWALQICEVLEYLHSLRPLPVIFRDLKPSNVMLTPQNQTMLIDFGIAKILQPERRNTMIGTEGYSPPEQYKGYADPRSDIYALGAMLHHLLTGSDPRLETPFTFHERLPRLLNPAISEAMEAVMMKCLAYESDQRWQTIAELKDALGQALHLTTPAAAGNGQHPHALLPEAVLSPQQMNGPRHATLAAAALDQPRVTQVFQKAAGPRYAPQISPLAPSPPVLWSFKTEEEVRSSPALAHNTIYIGSYDHNLYALDASTGAFQWKFDTEGGICCTPACVGNLVIVGSEDHQVYAIHPQTSAQVWTYRTWDRVRSSPRVMQDMVVVGSDDGFVHALELRSGRQVWKFKTWREVRSSAAYAQGLLYIGSDDERVYALEAASGKEKWHFTAQGRICASPVAGERMIYVSSMDGVVYGIDKALGWTNWKHRTDNFLVASPTLSEGRLYVGSVDTYFYCLDASTGRQLWRFQSGGQITSTAAVAGGQVYFGCGDGAVYCLDARSGQLRWKFQTDGPVPSSPLVREGILYIGSNDHSLYALRCES